LKGIQLHYYQKKFPSKNTEKIGDQWLSSIKLYYSKKWEILYSITIKMTCIIAYKTFKQFFDSSNSLWVIAVLNVKIEPKCRNKGPCRHTGRDSTMRRDFLVFES
jgi:hypothetical protein